MKLIINGQDREVAAATVEGLLEELGLHPQGTVVERKPGDRGPGGLPGDAHA